MGLDLNKEAIIVNVTDFGADKFGFEDSGPAIIKAIEKVKELSDEKFQTVLNFEKGLYRITKETALVRKVHTSNTDSVDFPIKKIGILIENIKNLTIEANDSEILFEGDMMALGILQSENIKVNNLNWDFKIPSMSEMTIFDFDYENHTIDYFIPKYMKYEICGNSIKWLSEQDSKGNYYWQDFNQHKNNGIQVKYPSELKARNHYTHHNPFEGVISIEELENGLLRFTYKEMSIIPPEKGMVYEFATKTYRQTAGAFIWESKDIYVNNVKISYMHGFGFLVQMSENVYFDRLKIVNSVETGKFTSSFADGVHVSGAKGKIEITNSFFNNPHDDPINIHGTFTRVEEKLDDYTLRLNYIHRQQGGFRQFFPGDKVLFYSRESLNSSDNERYYTVKSVDGPNDDDLKSMLVTFEEKLPNYLTEKLQRKDGEYEAKYVAENATYTPQVLIKGNRFTNVVTRCILVTTRKKIVIEDNHFDPAGMATIFLSNDSGDWYESGPIRDLTIRNNVFYISTKGRTWWKYAPAIYFFPVTFEDRLPDYNHAIHKNILIEDNTFYLESDGALRAESVDNLKFINNKLYKFNEVRVLSPLPNGPETNSGSRLNVLEFKNSNNILVKDNFYEDGLKKNVLFEGMTKDNYKVKDNLHILTNRDEIINENNITSLKDNIKILELNTDLENFNKVEDVLYIDTQTDNTSISINVKTNRLHPTIIVENEDQNTREIAQNCFIKLNIYNGVNSFKIIASDDNSECITRLIILRHRKILDGIKSIKLGDKDLDIENKIIDFENKYNRKDLQVIANDINAKVEIDFRKDGDKKFALIRIRHEDGLSLEFYKYEIIVAK